jgi:hypothetical protein
MKTIFDKIDPKYIDCASGACEHSIHNSNAALWIGILVALSVITYKYHYGNKDTY